MKLAGFLVLIAAVFSAAYLAGAHFGPLTPGSRIQYTSPGPGQPSPGTAGGRQMSGSP